MSFAAMVRKEAGDLVREKRFGIWSLVFLSFWGLFLLFYLALATGPDAVYRRESPEGVHNLGEPAFFFYAIAFIVLALFMLSDGVTKERESGMLPLVGAKPIRRSDILLAKLASGALVYVGSFLVSLLPLLVLAWSIGFPVVQMIALLYAGPFLALYAFMLGLGLLVGVASGSSKVAIGSAAGIYLPLFLLMTNGPMGMLYQAYPRARAVAEYMPFEVAHRATQVVIQGGQMPWMGLALTLGLGVLFAVLAFVLFRRQEVAL